MRVFGALRGSLALLPQRDRRHLYLAAMAQMLTGLFDAAGVALFGIVVAISTSAVSGSALPTSVTRLLEGAGITTEDLLTTAVWLSVAAGLLLITKSVINVALTRRILRFLASRQAVVSGTLATELFKRPLVQLQARQSQDTAFALTLGVNSAVLGVLGQSITVASEASLLAILAIGLLFVDPIVAIFAVAFFAGVAFILQRILATRGRRLGEINSRAEVLSTALVQESLAAYREVLISHRRNLYVDRFTELRYQAASVQADLNIMSQVPKYIFEIALVIGAGLLAWTQFMYKDATAAMATIAIFLAAGSRVVPSMLRLQGSALGVRVNSGMAQPTIELARELAATHHPHDGGTDKSPRTASELAAFVRDGHSDLKADLVVEEVTYTYPGAQRPALDRVSLYAPPGTSVALVGSTGAGKSSLADVMLGILRPDAGEVRIGGQEPLVAISRWPGGLAYVPQEVAMSPGSIRRNVAIGLPDELIDDDLVWRALERARLRHLLDGGRQGLETIVGEGGVNLSGGQRQRLGIARALYTQPRLLVLDEATSALDAETERAVIETLAELEGEVTTVTIAHRLATIRHSDLIVYLEDGRSIAQGTFDHIVASVPAFARQVELMGLSGT
jgi:ABC-type multidrug transport system fused ATPase/permease subunit